MICWPLKGPAGQWGARQHLSSIQHWMSHCPLVFWCQKSKPSSQIRFYLLHWYRNWKLAISHDWQLFTICPVFWVVGVDHGRWQGHQGGWVGQRGGKKVVFYALNWREEWAEGLVWTCILSREVKDFSDVTQACEDGHQEKGHKVILASSSPFLKDLLVKNKHPHPLIYMRGV